VSGDRDTHDVTLVSVLTCPECGYAHRAIMPVDACQYYYDCPTCRAVLKPRPGDCCVFCSYGTVKCPPAQAQKCCSAPSN